jgi:hypothetical protein
LLGGPKKVPPNGYETKLAQGENKLNANTNPRGARGEFGENTNGDK